MPTVAHWLQQLYGAVLRQFDQAYISSIVARIRASSQMASQAPQPQTQPHQPTEADYQALLASISLESPAITPEAISILPQFLHTSDAECEDMKSKVRDSRNRRSYRLHWAIRWELGTDPGRAIKLNQDCVGMSPSIALQGSDTQSHMVHSIVSSYDNAAYNATSTYYLLCSTGQFNYNLPAIPRTHSPYV